MEQLFYFAPFLCLFQFWIDITSGMENIFAQESGCIVISDRDSDASTKESDIDLLDWFVRGLEMMML
jgi:hypothetical protein